MASAQCSAHCLSTLETKHGQGRGVDPHRKAPAKRHLTVDDVCEDLEITRSTFYDWRLKRKAPPCFKLPNGEIRIRRADYEAWIASRMDAERGR